MAASRGDVNQKVFLGPETTLGVAVAATRKFPSLSLELQRMQQDQFYRPAGQLVPGSGVKHREWSAPTYNGGIDFNEIIYPLSGLFGAPTPTNPAGSAFQWVFTPTESDFGTSKTFTARQGDSVASAVAPGVHFNSMEFTMSEGEGEDGGSATISGECFGRTINDEAGPINATLTDEVQQIAITGSPTGGSFTITFSAQTTTAIAYNATAEDVQTALRALSNIADNEVYCYGGPFPDTPVTIHFANGKGGADQPAVTTTDFFTGGSTPATAVTTLQAGGAAFTTIAQQPASMSQTNLYIDDTFGALGTTKFPDCLEFYWTLPAIRNPVKVLSTLYPSFKDSVQQAIEEAKIRMTLIKNTQIISFMSTFNASDKPTRFVRFEILGPVITGAHRYLIQLDYAVKCETPKDRRNVQKTYAYDVEARLTSDAGMGPVKITVKNTRSAL